MKKKALNKKLMLNKKTIAHLKSGEMHHIAGGVITVPVPPVPGPITPTGLCTANYTNCVYCPTNCAWMTSCHTCVPTCP